MSEVPITLREALADRYVLERELGSGGMARVYLATDVRHERRVAVKVLRPELAATLGVDRFLREIRIAAQLNHPHIVPLLDSGDADRQLFYVMPFIDGISLRDLLNSESRIGQSSAVAIITEIADAAQRKRPSTGSSRRSGGGHVQRWCCGEGQEIARDLLADGCLRAV